MHERGRGVSETRIEDPVFGPLVRDALTGLWQGRVSLPLPGGDVSVLVFPEAGADGPSERQRDAARAALALTPGMRQRLEAMLYANYEDAAGDYEDDDEAAPPAVAAPADVWDHAWLQELAIPAHGDARGRYFHLSFGCDWEEEHGCEVLFRDGVPVQVAKRGGTSLPGWLAAQERERAGGAA